ncbi:MAG: ComF family protein [Nitrospinaceae bacterium]
MSDQTIIELFGRIIKPGRAMFQALVEGLFPRSCIFCGGTRDGSGDFLCGICRNEIRFIRPPFCHCCGVPAEIDYDYPHPDFECGLCRKKTFAFDRARSMAPYDTVLRGLIHHLKYQKQPGVISEITPMLGDYFKGLEESWEEFYVSPVPLHIRKMRERTFDQSFLIARQVARVLRLPLANGLLRRVRETEPQAKKTKGERGKNIQGAFQVNREELGKGKKILLVDDVFTTGATLHEASRVLKRAGAERVHVFTLARVLIH